MDQFLQDDVDIYLVQHQQQVKNVRKLSISLEKSHDANNTNKTKNNTQVHKECIKSKFVEKIKKISNINQSYPVNSIEEGYSIHSLSKKQRNRISAKQSRDRKKLYIELMEFEQKKLQKQLADVEQQIIQTKGKITKFCSSNKSTVGFPAMNQLQMKLAQILQEQHTQNIEQQLNIILDSIGFRMGVRGRQRLQKQNQCYKQIVNLSITFVHRYIMWTATENTHLFTTKQNKTNESDQFPYELLQAIQQNIQNYEQIEMIKKQIIKAKQNLIQLITKLWQIKGKIDEQMKILQNQVISIRQVLTPIQAAKSILFASRQKYRKYIKFFPEDKQRNYLPQNEEYIHQLSKPIKKVKKQEQN